MLRPSSEEKEKEVRWHKKRDDLNRYKNNAWAKMKKGGKWKMVKGEKTLKNPKKPLDIICGKKGKPFTGQIYSVGCGSLVSS